MNMLGKQTGRDLMTIHFMLQEFTKRAVRKWAVDFAHITQVVHTLFK